MNADNMLALADRVEEAIERGEYNQAKWCSCLAGHAAELDGWERFTHESADVRKRQTVNYEYDMADEVGRHWLGLTRKQMATLFCGNWKPHTVIEGEGRYDKARMATVPEQLRMYARGEAEL